MSRVDRLHRFPLARGACAAAGMALITVLQIACSADSALILGVPAGAHVAPSSLAADADVIDGQTVFNVQLRTVPGFVANSAWGNMQLKLGFIPPGPPSIPAIPPDPCRFQFPATVPDGMTPVSVCGHIENPGGATIQRGGLYFLPQSGDGVPQLIRSFGNGFPPDPCTSYDLGGFVNVPSDLAGLIVVSPGVFAVLFDGQMPVGPPNAPPDPMQIGGLLDGSAWGAVGDIDRAMPVGPPIDVLCTISIRPDA